MSAVYCSDEESSTAYSKKLTRRVCIPAGLLAELEAFGLREIDRDVIYWIVFRSLTSKKGKTPINTRVLDASLGSHSRRRIKAFLSQSAFLIQSPGGYDPGARSKCYEINPHTVVILRQHDNDMGSVDGGLGMLVDGIWRSINFGSLLGKIEACWLKLGFDRSKKDAAWSLGQVDEPTLSPDAVTAQELKSREISPKKASKKRSADYDAMAEVHRATLSRWWNDRMSGIFRRDGRQYSVATCLPRWIRREVIRYQGQSETVDVSAAYIWILAARHRRHRVRSGMNTTQVDALLDLIEGGRFYDELASRAGCEATDAKRQFQIFCLFGDIGKHRLWWALESLCSGVCDDIRWWRNQTCGASRLADMLQRAEGGLIDPMVSNLVDRGIGGVRIHDGAVIAAGSGNEASEWLANHSRAIYGRACRVKVM